MRLGTRLLCSTIAFLAFTHRCPAPIQEIPDQPSPSPSAAPATPKPAPAKIAEEAPKKQAAPSPVRSAAPKPAPPAKAPVTHPAAARKFSGKWKGNIAMPASRGGRRPEITYTVNATQDLVTMSPPPSTGSATSRALVNGNSISWRDGVSQEYTTTLSLLPDGKSAQIAITSASGNGGGIVTKEE